LTDNCLTLYLALHLPTKTTKRENKNKETENKEKAMYETIGQQAIVLLGIKRKSNGRVDTAWGDKSNEGLGRTIARIVHENETA